MFSLKYERIFRYVLFNQASWRHLFGLPADGEISFNTHSHHHVDTGTQQDPDHTGNLQYIKYINKKITHLAVDKNKI
jgi:hypothetical protein